MELNPNKLNEIQLKTNGRQIGAKVTENQLGTMVLKE
jgi:hypothetical protein